LKSAVLWDYTLLKISGGEKLNISLDCLTLDVSQISQKDQLGEESLCGDA